MGKWYTYYNAVDENMYVPQSYSLTILSDLSTQTTDLKRQVKKWMDINMKPMDILFHVNNGRLSFKPCYKL